MYSQQPQDAAAPALGSGGLGRPQVGSYGLFAIKGHHHCGSPAQGSQEASRTIELLVTQPETARTSRQSLGPQGHGQGQPHQGLYQVIWTKSQMFRSSQWCVLSKRCNRFPALAPFLYKIHATYENNLTSHQNSTALRLRPSFIYFNIPVGRRGLLNLFQLARHMKFTNF